MADTKPKKKPIPISYVWYESREKEPTMFAVGEFWPIRNFSNGRLEYEIPISETDRFETHHFLQNGRIVRKR